MKKLLLFFLPAIIYFVFLVDDFQLIKISDTRYGGPTWVYLGEELKIFLSLLLIPILASLFGVSRSFDSSKLKINSSSLKRLWYGQNYKDK